MRTLIIIALAGLLSACTTGRYVGLSGPNFEVCKGHVCTVDISVVGTGSAARIVPSTEHLIVTASPVTIQFRLNTAGYSFATPAGQGIEFKAPTRAGVQFTRDHGASGPKLKVMTDKNTNMPNNTYAYTIRVVGPGGGMIELDPIIINGGGSS